MVQVSVVIKEVGEVLVGMYMCSVHSLEWDAIFLSFLVLHGSGVLIHMCLVTC